MIGGCYQGLVSRGFLKRRARAALIELQGGVCVECQTPVAVDGSHLDHDHGACTGSAKTCPGCIRAALHPRCNAARRGRERRVTPLDVGVALDTDPLL